MAEVKTITTEKKNHYFFSNVHSFKQKKSQIFFVTGRGTTYIMLKILPEFGSRKHYVLGYICLGYMK